MELGKKIKKVLNNIILCIRFPFLYPRNRFTGLHYNNWKLNEKLLKFRKKGFKVIPIQGEKDLWEDLKIKTKIKNYKYAIYWYLLKFYYHYILQIIHCIPTYSELDSMPKGWRKAFGVKMCKEIAKELRKKHLLYKYHIMDIKEKYGELRWYDSGCSHKVFGIIEKYTIISQKTCINCGKSAKWLKIGWISPYCDDCKVVGNKYEPLYETKSQNYSNLGSTR